ncbi:hypothetical protein FVE85_7320 [Porphyridium purpureum]|uniref:RRM domain-containing protein n=1 Tax=Porphyridium purpureum TaxID=35688 RepID=A0A5J4Z8T5_PORPP|nr:hypothetical protein FVE85_7320 [Porphyridium purpureum]|eukprot:POR2315..scf295_1
MAATAMPDWDVVETTSEEEEEEEEEEEREQEEESGTQGEQQRPGISTAGAERGDASRRRAGGGGGEAEWRRGAASASRQDSGRHVQQGGSAFDARTPSKVAAPPPRRSNGLAHNEAIAALVKDNPTLKSALEKGPPFLLALSELPGEADEASLRKLFSMCRLGSVTVEKPESGSSEASAEVEVEDERSLIRALGMNDREVSSGGQMKVEVTTVYRLKRDAPSITHAQTLEAPRRQGSDRYAGSGPSRSSFRGGPPGDDLERASSGRKVGFGSRISDRTATGGAPDFGPRGGSGRGEPDLGASWRRSSSGPSPQLSSPHTGRERPTFRNSAKAAQSPLVANGGDAPKRAADGTTATITEQPPQDTPLRTSGRAASSTGPGATGSSSSESSRPIGSSKVRGGPGSREGSRKFESETASGGGEAPSGKSVYRAPRGGAASAGSGGSGMPSRKGSSYKSGPGVPPTSGFADVSRENSSRSTRGDLGGGGDISRGNSARGRSSSGVSPAVGPPSANTAMPAPIEKTVIRNETDQIAAVDAGSAPPKADAPVTTKNPFAALGDEVA